LVTRKALLFLAIPMAATLLFPGIAAAKGSILRFEQEQYAPGDHAVAHAEVETWPGSGEPQDAPFTVYLVDGGPLWFGHLPTDAMPVGELNIGHQVPDKTEVGDTYRVSVAFEVPRVADGRYSIWVCAPAKGGKGCWLGFGDLVYGRLRVAASVTSPGIGARPIPGAPEPSGGASTSAEGSLLLVGIALALVAIATLTAVVVRRQHHRASA